MGKVTGFKEFNRKDESYNNVEDRVQDYNEFTIPLNDSELKDQGARCMDCGIPFCHSGCPLGNLIPDFNHMVYQE
jgi:glutamate synthase (NADPH) small chain